jgi:Tol biopolymer transport system component
MTFPRVRPKVRRLLTVAAALLLVGCTNSHDRPHGHSDMSFGVSPSGGELVFNANGEGGRDLYRLDLTNFRVTRIAATPDYEVAPQFSPDGKTVVYAAGKPGDRADHIFVRSLDGKTIKQLTKEDANDATPAFSPDGSLIVFTRDKTYNFGGLASNWDAGGVLCVIKIDGTGLRQLTKDDSFASCPQFSPDGKIIRFWGLEGTYAIDADGSQAPKHLGTQGNGVVFSPDGQSIAYSAGRYSGDQRIYLAKADGTGSRKLAQPGEGQVTAPGSGCYGPSFTPDGKRIIFYLEFWPDGPTGVPKHSLWEVEIEKGNPRELADYGLFDDPLNWKRKAR